jgi:hypothetical protein
MTEIRLGWYEVAHGRLPNVCMICGTASSIRRKKRFQWTPPWALALLLCGIVPYLVFSFALAKRMTIFAPFCHDHRNHWRTRSLIVNLWLLAILLFGLALIIRSVNIDRRGPPGSWTGMAWAGMAAAFLVWLIVAAILQGTSIRPTEITNNSLTLKGVNNGFIAALQELRESPANVPGNGRQSVAGEVADGEESD